MDGMEAVSIAIIWQAGGAADAGDDGSHVRGHSEFGHSLMEAVENGMVATSGTPAHTLVALIVGGSILLSIHQSKICSIFSTNSLTMKGWP